MLCYWILRRIDGTAAGLVRVQDDRVTLKPTAPIEGRFTLFSDAGATPILPETETIFPCAVALLGMDGDRMTCFAAAENAAPIATYRERLSHFRTMSVSSPVLQAETDPSVLIISHDEVEKTEPVPELRENSNDMPHFSTISTDSVSDSARDAQTFSQILQRAEAFYAAYEGDPADSLVHKEDISAEPPGGIDLFSQEFPGARWRYVDGTDVLPHYEGTWKQPNGQTLHLLAVRGRAAPRPPRALLGFTRFLRDRDGAGYWLRITPLP